MSAYMILTLEEMLGPEATQYYAANVDGVAKKFDGTYLVHATSGPSVFGTAARRGDGAV
jgi:uncharacterized protein (DUF1330 family)